MASTAVAARLTETHRLAQVRLGARTVQDMLAAFRLLDPADLDSSFAAWLRVALPLIQSQHEASAQLAVQYLQAFRALEIGADPTFAPVLAQLNTKAVTTSLTVTGPVSIKQAMTRGLAVAQAVTNARAASSRTAMRHALAGGRDTISRSVAADGKAAGYRRVTSGKACKFCLMLAGRGAVYSARTVDFASHDGCSCSSEPVYAR